MLEQTRQFRPIKSEEGSDRAVEFFMERIQEKNEAGRMLEGEAQHVMEEYGEGIR